MVIVIINGQSASGKTALSEHLLNKLIELGIDAQKINMDDYYKEREKPDSFSVLCGLLTELNIEFAPEALKKDYDEKPLDKILSQYLINKENPQKIFADYYEDQDDFEGKIFRVVTNFDTPDQLHFELLKEHIDELSRGNSITKPLFDFKSNRRDGEQHVTPSEVIIMEGIFAQLFSRKHLLPLQIPTVSVNVATESYKDIIERRIARDTKERNRSKKAVLKQERCFVGPGFFEHTAAYTTESEVYVVNKHKETKKEQDVLLNEACEEIIPLITGKLADIQAGTLSPRKSPPNCQEILAQSYQLAGKLDHKGKFEAYFHGVFGLYKGNFKKEFSQEDTNRSLLIADLNKYLDGFRPQHAQDELRSFVPVVYPASFYLAKNLLNGLTNHPEHSIHELFENTLSQYSEGTEQLNDELVSIINKAKELEPAAIKNLSN